MATVSFTVSDNTVFTNALVTTADTGNTTLSDVLVAFRDHDPNFVQIQIGVDANTNAPIIHTLTDTETMNKIMGAALQGVLDQVTSYKMKQALLAAQSIPPASFVVKS